MRPQWHQLGKQQKGQSLGTCESITVPSVSPNWLHISGFKQDIWWM